jgi:GAF domain-containing protein/CheY-like chemotaxis protein
MQKRETPLVEKGMRESKKRPRRGFLQSLNTASAQLLRAARSEGELYESFRVEVGRLGYFGILALQNQDQGEFIVSASAAPYSDSNRETANKQKLDDILLASLDVFLRESLDAKKTLYLPPRLLKKNGLDKIKSSTTTEDELPSANAWILCPIHTGGQTTGVLGLSGSGFEQRDVPAVELFSDHVAVALDNACLIQQSRQMEDALRRRAEELAVLHDISLDITVSLDLPELLETILQKAVCLLKAFGGLLFLNDTEKGETVCVVSDPNNGGFRGKSIKFGEGAAGTVAKTGEALIIDDYAAWENQSGIAPSFTGKMAVLTVPMVAKGQVLGVLQVVDDGGVRSFSHSDSELLTLFADQAAIAIENARLLEGERHQRDQAESLREVARVVSGSLDLSEVIDRILEQLARVLVFDSTSVFLLDEQGKPAVVAGIGYQEGFNGISGEKLKNSPLLERMASDLKPVLIGDIQLVSDWVWAPASQGARSFLAVPIVVRQQMIGALMADRSHPNFYTENDLHTAQAVAQHMAVAIENARLFEQAAVERRHLKLLYDIGQELATSLDPDTILFRALALTCQALGGMVGEGFLYIQKQQCLSWRAIYGLGEAAQVNLFQQNDLSQDQGLSGWVAKTCQAVIVPDLKEDPHWLPVEGLDSEAVSAISAPIVEESRLLGVLSILHSQSGAFNQDHLELLKAICQQVSLALSNAQRYQQVQNLVDRLAVEQYRLESLVERLPVGVLLLDHEYRLLVSNPLARDILDALGVNGSREALTKIGDVPVEEVVAHQHDPLPYEIFLKGSSNRIFEVQACALAGETPQWVLTLREVTRERENQKRIQMQERLATVGQMAAGIAHDFNNIMAAILVYADLLVMDTTMSSGSRDRLKVIQEQVNRASSLIRQILDFSRRSIMEQISFDLLPFLKELQKLLRRLLPENIHLELVSSEGSYLVRADPTRLQQVFMNLALNARDAMPDGGKLLFEVDHLSFDPQDQPPLPDLPPGNWISITASDTGIGISADIMPHIFEPFFTTKPVGEGTGLGLAQVYGIIKQHNGFIDVESEPGKGAIFTIYLPALAEIDKDDTQEEVPSHLDGEGAAVLLVEDDNATREALQQLLTSQNFWVLPAVNGVEAFKIYNQAGHHISLVISDVVMPEMGGMSLYRSLQRQNSQLKMLFITGHPVELESEAILEKGKIHWLQKPFSVQEFTRSVQILLGSS